MTHITIRAQVAQHLDTDYDRARGWSQLQEAIDRLEDVGVLDRDADHDWRGDSIATQLDIGDADNADQRFADSLLEWSTNWPLVAFLIRTPDGGEFGIAAGDWQ